MIEDFFKTKGVLATEVKLNVNHRYQVTKLEQNSRKNSEILGNILSLFQA